MEYFPNVVPTREFTTVPLIYRVQRQYRLRDHTTQMIANLLAGQGLPIAGTVSGEPFGR